MTAITSPARRGRAGTRVGGMSDVARSSTAPYSMAAGKNHDVLQKKMCDRIFLRIVSKNRFFLHVSRGGGKKYFNLSYALLSCRYMYPVVGTVQYPGPGGWGWAVAH